MSLKKQFLIVKIGAIGDVVMALPMITELRSKYPGCHITWMCGKIPSEILKLTPGVDRLLCIDEKKLFCGNFFEKIQELFLTWKKLGFFKKFSKIFIAHKDPRYQVLTWFALSSEKTSFSRAGKRNFPIETRYLPDEHIRLITGIDDFRSPQAFFPALKKKKFSSVKNSQKRCIALAPGGAQNPLAKNPLRRWPIEHYVKLSQMLLSSGFFVTLTGSQDDLWILPFFKDLKIDSLVGKTSLKELFFFYTSCDLVLTHDSGPLHIASLAGTTVLGLFGPTPPFRFAPPDLLTVWEGKNLPCCPCYDGKNFAPCEKNLCMHKIDPELVFTKIKRVFSL